MKTKYHIISAIVLTCMGIETGFSQDQMLKLEDIWGSPKLFSRTAGGFNSMRDGEHYSNTVEGQEGTFIVRYNFLSGLATDTLLRPSQLVFEGKRIDFSDYHFSADESKLLLTVNPEAIYRHSTKEDYFILDRKKGNLVKITTAGKAMYATFSPNGDKLAYVRDNNLFYYDLSSGNEVAVSTDGIKNSIINGATDWVYEEEFSMDVAFAWSANGEQIAYYRFDESRVKEFNLTYYGELYPKEEKYKYPKAGEENSLVSLNIFSLKNKKSIRIAETGKEWEYIPRIAWTKNPDILSFQRSNRHQNVLELVLYNTATQDSKVVLREENSSFIEITDDLTFLDNGKQFIWTSSKSGFNHIYLYNLDGSMAKQVTSGSYDVTRYYGFDEKSGVFYFQSTERSPLERQLYAVSLKGKKKKLSEVAGIHNAEFSEGLRYFADTYSSLGSPHTCTLNSSADGKVIRTLTDNAAVRKALKEYRLGRCDTLSCLTADGVRLYGWMITPPEFDPNRKYPVLMHVYGGPGVQTVTNDWDGPNYLWHQLLAQKGYIVVSFDNRGTPGRGLDFANCIYKDMGNIEVLDQLSVLEFLKTKSYVDANRVGVWGWSFGGYMSSLLLTKGEGNFKAGIAVAPVTNWRYYDSIYTERYLQTPQENPKGYDENSPINYAKDLQGSFLLVHGSTDDNVHMQNTMDFVTALVKANKTFDLFIYPNKNHGIGGGNTRLHLYTKMTDFLLENL
jgi:dipeptidyl-peptidase-4